METDNCTLLPCSNLEPRDDMEFDTHEAAYEYYKDYAKSVGFGTAKLSSRRSRASREFIDAKFSCIRYGNKQQSDDAINPRPSPKIGCKASLHVKRKPEGKWYIHSFTRDHNHELLPAQAHFFRSHRNPDSGARVKKSKFLSPASRNCSAYHFPGSCMENVIRSQHDRGRFLSIEEGGAQLVLEICSQMHEENPKFFYALDFNEEHRLRNVFWVDAKGVDDFTYFGDVVSFDTTYFSSNYRIPLVFFIGVNHHIQPTLLGCGLIADDTLYTFMWLFQSWCLAMGGRSPKVLLTDQNDALKSAIQLVLPETRQFYHLWHVLENIPRRLHCISVWHEAFMEKFNKCIYGSWDEEKFNKRWWKLVERFNLQEDEWVQALYADRKLWVPVFMKGVCYVGLCSTSRSASLNSFFDRYINEETTLKDLVARYKTILEDRYEEEAKANFDAWHETPELKSPSPFEKQMQLIYTHTVFKKFQTEVLGAAACHLKKEKEDGSMVSYVVKDFEKNKEFMVEMGWDETNSDVYCSCRSFQYKGYLCRHSIVVLQMSGVFSIPFKYILQRLTNAATSKVPMSEKLEEVQAKVRRYNELCRRAIILGEEGSLSQESYDGAVGAVIEALKQCGYADKPCEDESRTPIQGVAGSEQHWQLYKSTSTNKDCKRASSGKELASNGGIMNKIGKVPQEPQTTTLGNQGIFQFQHTDFPVPPCYPPLYPRFLTTLLKDGEMSNRGVEMLGEMLEEHD